METTVITRRICLESRFLDQNIKSHIIRELSEKTKNECTSENGYILSIKELESILSHEIGRANGDNVFNIQFKACIFNPVVGKEVIGEVFHMFAIGIFINAMEKQKILIPVTSMTNYIYNELTGNYEHKDDNDSINFGDKINVIITDSQYNNGSFSCLGVLKDK